MSSYYIHGIINIVGAIPRNRPVDNVENRIAINDGRGENVVSERGENVVSPLRISNTKIMGTFHRFYNYTDVRREK